MEIMNNVIKAKESFQRLELHKSIREDYKSKKFISFCVVWSFGSFMFYLKAMTAPEWIGFSEWLLGIFFFFNLADKNGLLSILKGKGDATDTTTATKDKG